MQSSKALLNGGNMSEATVAAPSAAPTTTVDTVVVNSGDSSPVTFDDLDRVDYQAKAARKAEKAETKEIVKETVKAMDKAKGGGDGKDKENKKEVEADKKPGKTEQKAEGKEAGKEETKGKVGADKEEKVPKKIAGKIGDKAIEIDEETVIPVKINGKDEFVSVKDLQSQYSGRVAYDKKFQEMDKERKQFHSKVEEANSKIKGIFEEKDPEMRFYRMAEFSGVDPLEVRQKFLDENMNLLEKWYSMSEDERKADVQAYENKILKHQLESQGKVEAQRKAEQALGARIKKLEETHKFTPEEFWGRYDEIQEHKSSGKFPGEVTPEFVAETIAKDRLWNSAAEILNNSEGEMPQEKRNQALMDLVEVSYTQGLSAEQVREIADELWGQKAKIAAVESKVEENEEFRTGKKSKAQAATKKTDEPLFFSDIL